MLWKTHRETPISMPYRSGQGGVVIAVKLVIIGQKPIEIGCHVGTSIRELMIRHGLNPDKYMVRGVGSSTYLNIDTGVYDDANFVLVKNERIGFMPDRMPSIMNYDQSDRIIQQCKGCGAHPSSDGYTCIYCGNILPGVSLGSSAYTRRY